MAAAGNSNAGVVARHFRCLSRNGVTQLSLFLSLFAAFPGRAQSSAPAAILARPHDVHDVHDTYTDGTRHPTLEPHTFFVSPI